MLSFSNQFFFKLRLQSSLNQQLKFFKDGVFAAAENIDCGSLSAHWINQENTTGIPGKIPRDKSTRKTLRSELGKEMARNRVCRKHEKAKT